MEKKTEQYDVVIIGGGAAGLTSAIYCGRARLKTLVIEKALVGGLATYTNEIENYPGLWRPSAQIISARQWLSPAAESPVSQARPMRISSCMTREFPSVQPVMPQPTQTRLLSSSALETQP